MHLSLKETRTTVYVQNHTPHQVFDNKTPEEDFSREKPEVNHLIIFGFLVYIHIPKEKRTKLDPSRRKGIFIGYNDTSKSYRIYFPGFKKIDISIDVTFDEDLAYIKSRKRSAEEPKETRAPRIHDTTMNEEIQEEDREFEEPQEPVDPPQEKNPHKRKPTWVREIIQVAERYGASE